MQHHPILGGKEPEKPRETNPIEVVAVLAQVPVAIVALTQAKTVVALAILAVGVLMLLIAFRKSIGRLYRGRRGRKHDDQAARAALPQLRDSCGLSASSSIPTTRRRSTRSYGEPSRTTRTF
jgi:hypothetical protein